MVSNTIGYIISEGLHSMGKQKKMTTASIIIMVATMFMFGIFYVIGDNINYAMEQVERQQGMKVCIKDEATEEEVEKLKNEILQIDGVNTATYVSKEEALASVKTILQDNQYILTGYDNGTRKNPFPASFFVTLTDLSKNTEVQEQIYKLDNVDEINSRNDTIANLEKVGKTVRGATVILLALLVIISMFIIAYTIKLTVHARRKEISIMKYVGATNSFIRGPFIVEGVVIGIISALVSLLILGIVYKLMMNSIVDSNVFKFSSIVLYTFKEITGKVLIVYLLLGIGIGVLGSTISMKKYLEV